MPLVGEQIPWASQTTIGRWRASAPAVESTDPTDTLLVEGCRSKSRKRSSGGPANMFSMPDTHSWPRCSMVTPSTLQAHSAPGPILVPVRQSTVTCGFLSVSVLDASRSRCDAGDVEYPPLIADDALQRDERRMLARRFGQLPGLVVPADFDEPLPKLKLRQGKHLPEATPGHRRCLRRTRRRLTSCTSVTQ